MRSKIRYSLSVVGVTLMFGALVIAPVTAVPKEKPMGMYFQPGVTPSQKIITAAAEQAEEYLAALEVKELPEPEPEPQLAIEQNSADIEVWIEQQAQQAPTPEQPAQQQAPAPSFNGGGSPEAWMTAAGISPDDWGYVDFIASKESGWNPDATNSSSGACGLIQAYPCSKVPGSGYDPVDNLSWASGYATDRYGSWEEAYDFWVANSWW